MVNRDNRLPLGAYFLDYMTEVWKDIAKYEGRYQVSNKGCVRRLLSNGEIKYLNPFHKDKYLKNELWKNGKRKKIYAHRLVAEHFLPNPAHFTQVNHKDENPENNCVENLEWCSQKYNANYGENRAKAALKRSKGVEQYSLSGELLHVYPAAKMAAKCVGVSCHTINDACNKQAVSVGFLWKYADDEFIPMVVALDGLPIGIFSY